jgi:hypothetical protein
MSLEKNFTILLINAHYFLEKNIEVSRMIVNLQKINARNLFILKRETLFRKLNSISFGLHTKIYQNDGLINFKSVKFH